MLEILEHTADIGIRVNAPALPELFIEAAKGLQSIAVTGEVEPAHRYEIEAQGEDSDSLLVNFLNEIVYLIDGRHVVLAAIAIHRLTETGLKAEAHGEPFNPARHQTQLTVKAATYHQLRLAQQGSEWVAEVYFDI